MNQQKHLEDLHQGRGWLNRAAEMLDACEDHVSDAEFARAAAAIGSGFVALAHATEALNAMAATARRRTLFDAAAEREQRAEAEARPHDDEPVNLCETDADMAARFAGQVGELASRIETAVTWIDEPDDATPEIQLRKIRAALTGQPRRG